MIKTILKPVNECRCEDCGHAWDSLVIPSICPNCRTRAWNGEKKAGRPLGKTLRPHMRKETKTKIPRIPEYDASVEW